MDVLLIGAALCLAFSNGANDNFKGFATVWGAETLTYRTALALASAATVAGSLASLFLAETLVQQFSGKGLVPDGVAVVPQFILSVAAGAALTVLVATRAGLPVSTTHALIGGLVGAGLGQGGDIHFAKLADSFLAPLLISPLVAAGIGILAYRFIGLRRAKTDCACLLGTAPMAYAGSGIAALQSSLPMLVVGSNEQCGNLPGPVAARVSLSVLADRLHTLSAALICFARGVNDTPKLAALLIAGRLLDASASVWMIAGIMALGGMIFARRVAVTMSRRLTRLDATQGLAANLITAALVLFASQLGLPVSTTHVSVGSIAGVGMGAKTIDWPTVRQVLFAWVATLPLAAAMACSVALIARQL